MNKRCAVTLLLLCAMSAAVFPMGKRAPDTKPGLEDSLYSGKMKQGEESLALYTRAHPGDDTAKFELGLVRFMRSIERLAQTVYRLGPTPDSQLIPFLRLPVPKNKKPETATYNKFRAMIDQFKRDTATVQDTLASLSNKEIKIPLYIGKIKFDIDSDGTYAEWETSTSIFSHYTDVDITPEEADRFYIALDRADVHWLKGYCHLLGALCDLLLAFDLRDLFDYAAPYLFEKTENKPRKTAEDNEIEKMLVLKVKEGNRKEFVLSQMLSMIAESRLCFDRIQGESDDEREWIPNPMQTGVFPGMRVTKDMTASWRKFLDETEAILMGKVLLPIDSSSERTNRGLNLNKLILDKKNLDIPALVFKGENPAIENGRVTKAEFWSRLFRVFGGEFIGFALWFN